MIFLYEHSYKLDEVAMNEFFRDHYLTQAYCDVTEIPDIDDMKQDLSFWLTQQNKSLVPQSIEDSENEDEYQLVYDALCKTIENNSEFIKAREAEKRRQELLKRAKELESALAEVNKELDEMEV